MKDKLKVAKRTVEGLKDHEANKQGQEIQMLQNKLLVFEAQLSQANT